MPNRGATRAMQQRQVESRPSRAGTQDLFYAQTAALPRIVRGEGIFLWDEQGRRLLDVGSGAFLANLGQGNRRVLEAMARQGQTLSYSCMRTTTHAANAALTERLASLAGSGFERVHLSSGGSEAIEVAIRLLRLHAVAAGQLERRRLITLLPSYHGGTLQTLALNGDLALPGPYGGMAVFSERIPAPLGFRAESAEAAAQTSAAALEEAILRLGPETVLAFLMEPIGGSASGANVPHPSFYADVRGICSRYGVGLVYDEIVSAFRTGRFLAAQHYPDALPDLVVIAKGLGSGYAPLGAVLAPAALVDELAEAGGLGLWQSSDANPIACAAGSAVLDEVVERELIPHAERMGERLRAGLEGIALASPLIGDVRGKGLLLGIELVRNRETLAKFPASVDPAERIRHHGLRHGLLVYGRRMNAGAFGDWILITPPLVIDERECDELLERLARTLDDAAPELLA
jgi:adenosylmethionine-8-amino-7-oxononanoate aminotransferase